VHRFTHRRVLGLLALAVLIAIAAVLISPAVPSAPTVLPVSAWLLLGIMVMSSLAAIPADCSAVTMLSLPHPTSPGARLDSVTAALPLRN
jgi:hypothetical protein